MKNSAIHISTKVDTHKLCMAMGKKTNLYLKTNL